MSTKKRWGPSGSTVNRKDMRSKNRNYIPKVDPEIQIKTKLRMKLPPPKKLEDDEPITKEQFVDTWIDQRPIPGQIYKPQADDYAKLSGAEFMKILSNPGAIHKRLAMDDKMRMATALEYFGKMDERQWVEDQLELLRILDDYQMEKKTVVYDSWKLMYIKKIQRAVKMLNRKKSPLAEPFVEYAAEFMDSMRPKRPSAASMVIISQVRRLVLEGNQSAYRDFSEEMRIVVK